MPIVVRRLLLTLPSVALACYLAATPSGQNASAVRGEWRYYGADAAGTKYSPLDQITRDNVRNLKIVWRWKAENFGPRPEFNWEATPLMVNGVLYITAVTRRDVVAIDAATGETLWLSRHDEGRRGQIAPRQVNRGVGYWSNGRDERVIYITPGYHLIALNAKTGQPVTDFGYNGAVDLYEGLDRPAPQDGAIGASSPPIVVGDVVVVGAALLAGAAPTSKENIAGHIRGYDIHTGKRVWIFHTIPEPGELGNDTWKNDSWSYTGNTGAWGPLAADLELGYVYIPVETPTGDYYGGHRKGNNLFAESLVCLDAKTGKRVWHYQFVHHGIWDYDIPTAPNLVDITVNGRKIKAIAQVTKQSFTFVFDRVTGQPVWPIEERPVPQTDVPGEETSPTQPFPTKPPPFDRQGMQADDVIDFTPALKAEGLKLLTQYRTGPLFTPPSAFDPKGTKGTLQLPSTGGGANWQGAAVDPETGILYVSSNTAPAVIALIKDTQRSSMDWITGGGEGGGARGRGAAGAPQITGDHLGPQGLPLVKPPYGRITAIDLNTGDHVWMVPNGDTPESIKNHPALKGVNLPRTGSPEHAGLFVTKTLVFAGEGSGLFGSAAAFGGGGPMFRALDKQTGATVFEMKLPANQTGIPMSYAVNGRQFIALTIGARGQPAELIALAVQE